MNTPQIAANLEAEVIQKTEIGTHTVFIGKVVDAVDLPNAQMTYAEYHVMKNQSAKKAEGGGVKYRCKVCGYIHEGELPADFKCPLCGVGADMFEKITESETAESNEPEKYRCKVCGYIHEGVMDDDFTCPLCGVGADMFEKI